MGNAEEENRKNTSRAMAGSALNNLKRGRSRRVGVVKGTAWCVRGHGKGRPKTNEVLGESFLWRIRGKASNQVVATIELYRAATVDIVGVKLYKTERLRVWGSGRPKEEGRADDQDKYSGK